MSEMENQSGPSILVVHGSTQELDTLIRQTGIHWPMISQIESRYFQWLMERTPVIVQVHPSSFQSEEANQLVAGGPSGIPNRMRQIVYSWPDTRNDICRQIPYIFSGEQRLLPQTGI
jgi:hypothetical protein